MVKPIELSRSQRDEFYTAPWNAFVELVGKSKIDVLNPVQRIAHLAFWYDAEVQNGGHDQYFASSHKFDHKEAIKALAVLGAECQKVTLEEAYKYYKSIYHNVPRGYDEFNEWDKRVGYYSKIQTFDERYYNCHPELLDILEGYLANNESEFIKWCD